jgi:hypothetical protein
VDAVDTVLRCASEQAGTSLEQTGQAMPAGPEGTHMPTLTQDAGRRLWLRTRCTRTGLAVILSGTGAGPPVQGPGQPRAGETEHGDRRGGRTVVHAGELRIRLRAGDVVGSEREAGAARPQVDAQGQGEQFGGFWAARAVIVPLRAEAGAPRLGRACRCGHTPFRAEEAVDFPAMPLPTFGALMPVTFLVAASRLGGRS